MASRALSILRMSVLFFFSEQDFHIGFQVFFNPAMR